ncbi:hypothetical protein KKH30_03145 [Candidatus Micrarchaeota archaeon]|nr:hypothetical protein [Candidatus Micrarchaeota archaeon]MBU1939732.1 hypothetical protein [Candidatus Micrarchaeota archaeon]
MLGFILSKLNLLILVVAIFAIVAFFTTSLADVMKQKEAQEISTRVMSKANALVNSPTSCDSVPYNLPPHLAVSGGEFFYVMKISTAPVDESENLHYVIFQIFPRRNQEHALAGDSFITDAEISLFELTDDKLRRVEGTGNEILIDPQAANPINAMVFVKEIELGESKLYIIPCNSALCESYKEEAGNIIHVPNPPEEEGGFRC